MKLIINCIFITLLSVNLTHGTVSNTAEANSFFTKANTFFGKHVTSGKVNYKAIKGDPSSLNELVEMASTLSVIKSDKNTYQAFWINAYNITVIKLSLIHI